MMADDDDGDDVEFMGERSLEERNREGFAHAINLEEDVEEAVPDHVQGAHALESTAEGSLPAAAEGAAPTQNGESDDEESVRVADLPFVGNLSTESVDAGSAGVASARHLTHVKGRLVSEVVGSRVLVQFEEGGLLMGHAGTVAERSVDEEGVMRLHVRFDSKPTGQSYSMKEDGDDGWDWEPARRRSPKRDASAKRKRARPVVALG